ncbi:hypothetical protein ORV05_19840 [Amycolatopsis cynarae]|uniref:Uncharacterized protein n=1 Tax=Amycolatopsis cynarae TaxID=2995223 RepID=A0ABY7AXC5_9PSEU|nr:hypothetical protein [Amycolatopsis sp. HUAS 11-8]WAL63278.1 hypothetical protein ORV05_19840 [Amycolatopsis sp. HUAS 11-8]
MTFGPSPRRLAPIKVVGMMASPGELDIALRAVARLPLPPEGGRLEFGPGCVHVVPGHDDRAARIYTGAAIFVLALALRVQGCSAHVRLGGSPSRPATIFFTRPRPPMPRDRRLAAALEAPAPAARLTGVTRAELERAAAVEGARLRFTGRDRAVLSTRGNGPADQLAAGMALARVLLSAASRGVPVRFLPAGAEDGCAQAVLVLGRAARA